MVNRPNSKTITLSLPIPLIDEIKNKRGHLPISLAYQILLKSGLDKIDGPLIENRLEDKVIE